ncbi:MAG TPA: hypothetical protein VGJ73_16015 [Verrucomicrobiae bacterium]|jgi:hypothetical protein
MSIRYKNLGGTKRLQEIVFAGSHDASITSGDVNAQTQDLNIGDQAEAGVRLFDLRILAKGSSSGASLVGYHGDAWRPSTNTLTSQYSGQTQKVKTSKDMTYGVTGEKLSDMLNQGKAFVDRTKEFLIFKFDKSTNYKLIGDYCVNLLGDSIYKSTNIEFSKLTLDDLAGKVVCVFNDKALTEMKPYTEKNGILGWRSLKGKDGVKPYDSTYYGLQYYGKGGTSAGAFWRSDTDKMDENVKKQKKLMLAMAKVQDQSAGNVLGMMYWTATGLKASIRKRNEEVLWGGTGIARMSQLWHEGLEESISNQLKMDKIKVLEYGGIRRVKTFFPNIVMIDFADPDKCQTIYDLNTAVDDKLAKAYDKYTSA